ncbi:HD domain-containing protein [Stieleria varia]
MQGQAAGHGMDHVLRVLRSARLIQAQAGGDLEVIELAALLHDVGDAKFHDGVERSAEFAREILSGLGASEKLIEHVAHIVDNISFRKGDRASALSLEGKIVQDADRLDALGAIGIVRTIEYGAAFGQPFYLPDADGVKTGIGHFHEKLFKLKDLLNTDAARQMAEQRESFMQSFLDQFMRECGLSI